MATTPTTWEGALRSFLLHLKATRAEKTVSYYKAQVLQLIKWANDQGIFLEDFSKRVLDENLGRIRQFRSHPEQYTRNCDERLVAFRSFAAAGFDPPILL